MKSVPENKLPTTPTLTQNKQKKTKFPSIALNFIGQPRRTQLPYFLAVDKPLVPRPSSLRSSPLLSPSYLLLLPLPPRHLPLDGLAQ